MALTNSESTAILREGLRLLILHKHRLGSLASLVDDRINQSMDSGTVSHITVTRWFNRFKQEDYDLENKRYSGRSVMSEDEMILGAVEENPHQSLCNL